MKKNQDELLNSNYDGIQEYDNDLPRWWKALFIITIIFAVIYSGYFLLGFLPSSEQQLAGELKTISEMKKNAPVSEVSGSLLQVFAKDSSHLEAGKVVFQQKCSPCHGPDGQGVVGPNLTDEYWIHGGKITDIYKTITSGVLDKGMLAWKGIITDDELGNVAAYVFSLKGTNPSNPKAPQGEKYISDE